MKYDLRKDLLKLQRQIAKMPLYFSEMVLAKEIELLGPIRKNWPNFSSLNKAKGIPKDSYHCHLKKGKPTYVACWCIENKKVKIIEIFYVGTHEKAPY